MSLSENSNNSFRESLLNTLKNGIPFSRLIDEDNHKNFFELIKCKICFNILKNPYDCTICGNTFCHNCINQLLIQNKKCPFTCVNFKIKPSSYYITSYLNKLQFSCLNKENGCDEIISYNNIDKHDQECKYFYTKCPNIQCGKKMKWTLLENHLKNECEYSVLNCTYCSKELCRYEYDEHIKNCNEIRASINNNIENIDSKVNEFENLISSLPDLKEVSLVSFLKILLYQVNLNNKVINSKFDSLKKEIEGIHKDINDINKNNMIFFESINDELENLGKKNNDKNLDNNSTFHESLLSNDDINKQLISNSINLSLNKPKSKEKNKKKDKKISGKSNDNNKKISNQKIFKKDINENINSSILSSNRMNEFNTKSKMNIDNKKEKNDPNSNEKDNQSIESNKKIYNQNCSKPFDSLSSYTNSNIVDITNNQEIILEKLNFIIKNQEDTSNKISKTITESKISIENILNSSIMNKEITIS